MPRRIVIPLACLAVVAVVALLLMPHPVPIQAGKAQRGEIRVFVEERAKTRLPDVYRITMPVPGRILPIELTEGTQVRQGEIVARLDHADLDTAVAEGKARVARLEAMITENNYTRLEMSALEGINRYLDSMDRVVEAAEEKTTSSEARHKFYLKELGRVEGLFARKSESETQLNKAQLDETEGRVDYQTDVLTLRALEAVRAAMRIGPRAIQEYIDKKSLRRAVLEKELAEARSHLDRLERDRARGELKSPVDGVVLKRLVSNERVLSAGEALLEIGRLEELEIEVEVLSQDAVHIAEGDLVDIEGPAIGTKPVQGKVTRIYPQGFTKVSSLGVEQQRVLVIVAFGPETISQLHEQGRTLGVDYRVRVKIYTDRKEHALTIPRSALFRSAAGGWQVFAIRNGRAVLTDLNVGLANDQEVEALTGIEPGDLVVLAPETNLKDGQHVRPHLQVNVP